MESLIALDIETTGLDPVKDAVIEIGAVLLMNAG
jgi:DNA polymerase III epsilon subunit-like protein